MKLQPDLSAGSPLQAVCNARPFRRGGRGFHQDPFGARVIGPGLIAEDLAEAMPGVLRGLYG